MKKMSKRQKKKFVNTIIITSSICFVIICLLFSVILILHKRKAVSESDEIDYSQIEIEKPVIKEMYLTKNVNSRPGTAISSVNGIVIHYTANPGTDAKANRNYFESRKDCSDEAKYKVSSNFIVGLKGQIIACVPENEIAYASNNRNSDTLSIECCHPDSTGKFNDKTYNSLVKLVAYLCCKYNVKINNIIRHYDITGKLCPKYYVENKEKWIELKSDIEQYIISKKRISD